MAFLTGVIYLRLGQEGEPVAPRVIACDDGEILLTCTGLLEGPSLSVTGAPAQVRTWLAEALAAVDKACPRDEAVVFEPCADFQFDMPFPMSRKKDEGHPEDVCSACGALRSQHHQTAGKREDHHG